jgi:hypothetical protein
MCGRRENRLGVEGRVAREKLLNRPSGPLIIFNDSVTA